MESATATQTASDERSGQCSPSSATTTAYGNTERGWSSTLWRRRRILIDKHTQLRSVAIVGLFTLALLVPINLGIHVIHVASTAQVAADTPALVSTLEEQNRITARRVLIGSGVILLAAMSMTLFATHRTAGAAVGLVRGINNLLDGKYGAETILRGGDRLHRVERSLNELSRALLERSSRMAGDLDSVAEVVDGISESGQAGPVAERLRQMARQQRNNAAMARRTD